VGERLERSFDTIVDPEENVEITIKIDESTRSGCCESPVYIDSLAQLNPELKQLQDARCCMTVKIKHRSRPEARAGAVFDGDVLLVDEWVGRLENY
jgi:hypothetical protein